MFLAAEGRERTSAPDGPLWERTNQRKGNCGANQPGPVSLGGSRSLVIVLGDERVVFHPLLAASTSPTCAPSLTPLLSLLPGGSHAPACLVGLQALVGGRARQGRCITIVDARRYALFPLFHPSLVVHHTGLVQVAGHFPLHQRARRISPSLLTGRR